MNEDKLKRFLKLRYFLTLFIVIQYIYILFGIWIMENSSTYGINWMLFISAILILINNRWVNITLILLNIFAFVSDLIYIIGRCLENFPVNTLRDSYYWLIDMTIFRWNVAYWILQISLIIYLIALEVKVYKNKNSLV